MKSDKHQAAGVGKRPALDQPHANVWACLTINMLFFIFLFFYSFCRENKGIKLRVTHLSAGILSHSVSLNNLKLGVALFSLCILKILILLYPRSREAGQIKGFIL